MRFDPPIWSHMKSQLSPFFLPLKLQVFPVAVIDTWPVGLGDLSRQLGLYAPSLDRQTIIGDAEQWEAGCTGPCLVLSFFTSRLMLWVGLCRKKHHCQRLSVNKDTD